MVGLAAGLVWGLSPLVWFYHIGAEVFALNNALVATAMALTADILASTTAGRAPWWRVIAGGLVAGLALSNQHTSVLFLIVLIPAVMIATSIWAKPSLLITTAAAAVAGVAPYAWLPIAHTWYRRAGSWGDSSTLIGFLNHVRRADYGTFQLYSGATKGAEGMWARTSAFASEFVAGQLPFGAATDASSSIFLVPSWRKNAPLVAVMACVTALSAIVIAGTAVEVWGLRRIAKSGPAESRPGYIIVTMVLCLVVYLGVFHNLSNMPLDDILLYGVHARFWMQPMAALVAIIVPVISLASSMFLIPGAGAGAIIALVAATTALRMPEMDQSGNLRLHDYAKGLIKVMPYNATLITAYDFQWTATRYLSQCEGLRPDVTLLNAPMMSFGWFQAQRSLYPSTIFPGTHLVKALTQPHADGGFSWEDFAAANAGPTATAEVQAAMLRRYGPIEVFSARDVSGSTHSPGSFVIAGDMMHKADFDTLLHQPQGVKLLPRGFTSQVISKQVTVSCADLQASGFSVQNAMSSLKLSITDTFPLDSWEHAVWLETWARVAIAATELLDMSIAEKCLDGILMSANLLQLLHEKAKGKSPASLLKNFGLALTHIVKSKTVGLSDTVRPLPLGAASLEDLKTKAAQGVVDFWGAFLAHPDASLDPSFDAISGVLQHLSSITGASAST